MQKVNVSLTLYLDKEMTKAQIDEMLKFNILKTKHYNVVDHKINGLLN